MKFFGEYDEKKAFNQLYKYLEKNKKFPEKIKKLIKVLPKVAQVEEDERLPVMQASMVPEFVQKNPWTSAGLGTAAALTQPSVRSLLGKVFGTLGTPTGAVAAWPLSAMGMKKAGWMEEDEPAFNIKSTGDRIGASAELALAPTLVSWTDKLTKPSLRLNAKFHFNGN